MSGNKMRSHRLTGRLGWAALVLLGLLAAGCGAQPIRTVTHVSTWSGPGGDYLYLAYAESEFVSRVKRCLIKDDNSLDCADQEALNKQLNEQ
ncbi:MAG: hypothetical protein KC620_23875 [Myxococcales bacterium]|nr:hypothetical protein [Myxococcales bacterium]